MAKKKAVSKGTGGALSVLDFSAQAGAGQEQIDASDIQIPFLRIIQKMSPVADRSQPDSYIEGARDGQMFNTVTRELFSTDQDEPVLFVPCRFKKAKFEYVTRENGGGLVAIHSPTAVFDTTRDDKNRDITADGTEIVDVRTIYAIQILGEGDERKFEPVVLSFSSTQLRKVKMLNALATRMVGKRADGTTYQKPYFSQIYSIHTVPEKNDKGSWFGYKIAHVRELGEGDEELYQTALELNESIKKGEARAATDFEDATPEKEEVDY